MAAATYASTLLRTHVRGVARLPEREQSELKRSVAELSAIGRNLNQLARVANQAGRPSKRPGSTCVAASVHGAQGSHQSLDQFQYRQLGHRACPSAPLTSGIRSPYSTWPAMAGGDHGSGGPLRAL